MNFLSPIYLAAILAQAPERLTRLAKILKFKNDEFLAACKAKKAQEADDILTDNLNSLLNRDNILFSLRSLTKKFPELDIDLSDTRLPKELIIVLGERADEMLEIAKERGLY